MSSEQPHHHPRRPRDEQDDAADDERLKRARANAATTPTPPAAAAAETTERQLASVAVHDLLPSATATTPAPTVSQPVQLGCWTKLSRLSGLPKERRFLFGDRRGLPRLALPPPSALPLSLDEGYPDRFVRKPEGERSGVEAVVRGAQHLSTAPSPAAVVAAAAAAAAGGGSAATAATSAAAAAAGGGIDWSIINVVTYRNNLNKILGVPIDTSARADGWCIDAVLLAPGSVAAEAAAVAAEPAPPTEQQQAPPHRVLFLDIQPDPGGERTFPGQDRFMYYGYKLETVCTAEQPQQQEGGGRGGGGAEQPPPPHQQHQHQPPLVDSTSEYGALVAVRLGRHRVLMAAEIDAEEEEDEEAAGAGGAAAGGNKAAPQPLSPLARLAEIKCYRPPPPPQPGNGYGGRGRGGGPFPPRGSNRAAETLFRLKHQRWWVQSFLAGVPTLVLGSRDDRGNLVAVQKVPVARLPDISARNGFPWEGSRLVAFGDAALAWMRAVAEEEAEAGAAAASAAAGVAAAAEGGGGEPRHLRFRYDPRAGELRAAVVEGGELPARVRRALEERGGGGLAAAAGDAAAA